MTDRTPPSERPQHDVWVAVGYTGYYLEGRKRNPDHSRFVSMVPVSIQEIDAEDAPVVIEIDGLEGSKTTVTYRHDGEHFWRPMLDSDDATLVDFESFKERSGSRQAKLPWVPSPYGRHGEGHWQEEPPAWIDWPFPRRAYEHNNKITHENPHRLRIREECEHRWHSDDLAGKSLAAEQMAENVAVIGGIVHLRTAEPYLVLTSHGTIKVQPPLPGRSTRSSSDGLKARLDRLELLTNVHLANRRAWEDDQEPSRKGLLDPEAIRILDPSCLQRDDLKDAIDLLLKGFVEEYQKGLSQMASTGSIRLWADMKDAADDYYGGDETALDRALELFEQLMESDLTPTDEKSSYSIFSEYDHRRYRVQVDHYFKPLRDELAPSALNAFAM